MKISNRVQSLGSYVFARPKLGQLSRKILDLGAGNPVLPPSQQTMQLLSELTKDAQNYRYAGYGAIPVFFESIKKFYHDNFGVTLELENLHPLLGAKDGVGAVTLALADVGDEVLIPNPGYPAYRALAKLYGVVPISYELKEENQFQLDINELEKLRTSKTKFIWINFPSNPTGQIPNSEILSQLINWCLKNKIWLVYDNAYMNIRFDGLSSFSVLELPRAKEIAVELCSLSKSHSLAGLRIGWVVGNSQAVSAISKVKSQLDSGMSLLLQKLAAEVLATDNISWQKSVITTYEECRDLIKRLLIKLDLSCVLPAGGLYIWLKVPAKFGSGQALADFLYEEKGILVTPGEAFGSAGKNYVRLSVTADPKLIKEFL